MFDAISCYQDRRNGIEQDIISNLCLGEDIFVLIAIVLWPHEFSSSLTTSVNPISLRSFLPVRSNALYWRITDAISKRLTGVPWPSNR
jgi:hypothetical protein